MQDLHAAQDEPYASLKSGCNLRISAGFIFIISWFSRTIFSNLTCVLNLAGIDSRLDVSIFTFFGDGEAILQLQDGILGFEKMLVKLERKRRKIDTLGYER